MHLIIRLEDVRLEVLCRRILVGLNVYKMYDLETPGASRSRRSYKVKKGLLLMRPLDQCYSEYPIYSYDEAAVLQNVILE